MRSTLRISPESTSSSQAASASLARLLAVHGAEHVAVEALDAHAHASDAVALEHLDVRGGDRLGRRLDGVDARAGRRRAREDRREQLVEELGGSAVGVPPPTKSCESGVPGSTHSSSRSSART